MMRLLVLGGGPAGLFCAVSAAELRPGLEVVVLEREAEPLRRLRPGRGSLSLTRLLPPEELLRGYPRGAEAMEGWLHVWQARDTRDWFAGRDVPMDVLPGGALVPGPNAGERAREALLREAARLGVRIHCSTSVAEAAATSDGFRVWAKDGPPHDGDFLLLATGGQGGGLGYGIAQYFGHSIVPALPSLTLLQTRDARLRKLHGLDVPGASARVPELGLEAAGGVSLLPQGLGGPAILELTSRAARALAERDYVCLLEVNWVSHLGGGQPTRQLREIQAAHPKRNVVEDPQHGIPQRLWERLVDAAGIAAESRWSGLSPSQLQALAGQMVGTRLKIDGRAVNKAEWVTSGGVPLHEVDPQSMQSRMRAKLFFAGEILDIDGLAGGYNLQAAWTTARVAAQGVAAAAR